MTFVTVDGKKISLLTFTGPSADTSVDATSSGTVAIPISSQNIRIVDVIGIAQISGLPDGVVLVGFAKSGSNINLTVYNTTGSAVTVSAGSVTVKALVEGF